jgi:phosphate regulon transcriptional regulator PhoB
MKKILVIDDEMDIVELVSYNLINNGFSVDSALDGDAALKKLKSNHYDLIILDLMLPSIDGFQLCNIIRNDQALSSVPIIMLTARGDEFDKVHGLEMGADDYITKPFSIKELVARTKAVMRRAQKQKTPVGAAATGKESILRIKELAIDTEKYTVTVGDDKIKLSATEFKLLLYLAERPKKVFIREHLLDAVWGNDIFVEPRTVDVHIRRIRAKIERNPDEPEYIKTMRGIGYFFDA